MLAQTGEVVADQETGCGFTPPDGALAIDDLYEGHPGSFIHALMIAGMISLPFWALVAFAIYLLV